MKKLLITTTAIIGASMIASAAHAESNVSASGSYTSSIYLGGDDTTQDSMTFGGSTFDLNINASKTTDSGLALSAVTSLDVTDPATGNETSAAIAGGFGTISFSDDGGGAASVDKPLGLSVAGSDVGDVIANDIAGSAGVGASDNTITYTSPNINGLTFGYTMGENGGDSEYNAEKQGTAGNNAANTYNRPIFGADGETRGQTSYAGFGVKYSMAGAFINFASASQTTSYTVKGEEDDILIDHDDDAMTAPISANGEYSVGWSGTAIGLGYATGPFAVRYSTVTKEMDDEKRAGEARKIDPMNKGTIANQDTNETQIGISFNYGAGTISYVSSTEDTIKLGMPAMDGADALPNTQDAEKSEDVTATVLAVSHNLANGITVGFEMHSADANIDVSKAGYESASENILTIGLNF